MWGMSYFTDTFESSAIKTSASEAIEVMAETEDRWNSLVDRSVIFQLFTPMHFNYNMSYRNRCERWSNKDKRTLTIAINLQYVNLVLLFERVIR